MYQKLKSIGLREHLPAELQGALDRLCILEAAAEEERRVLSDPAAHAAFAFIRIKPIRLLQPVFLFAESVTTRHIQEISLCRAVWDEQTQDWLPNEERPIFIAHMSSVQFSEAVMGSDLRTLPLTFVSMNGMPVQSSHAPLSADFLVDWAARQSSESGRITQCIENIRQFQTLVSEGAALTELKKGLSGLGVDYLCDNDPSAHARDMMHEVMSKMGKHLRAEIINEVCRATVAPTTTTHLPPPEKVILSAGIDYHGTDIVRMGVFYELCMAPDSLRVQTEILQYALAHPLVTLNRLVDELNAFSIEVGRSLSKLSSRVTKPGPLGEVHYLAPALSAGCIEISKQVMGRADFFGDHGDSGSSVDISVGLAHCEVDSCGGIKTRRPFAANARVSMTAAQFVELLQSSHIGGWTKCTLSRVALGGVPFPSSKNAQFDGRLSKGPAGAFPEQIALADSMATLRQLLMKKPLNEGRRLEIHTHLAEMEEILQHFLHRLDTTMDSCKSEVIQEHRARVEKRLTEILRLSDQLSLSAPDRIRDVLLLLGGEPKGSQSNS